MYGSAGHKRPFLFELAFACNRIGGEIVSVLVSGVLDLGSSPGRVKLKTIKKVFVTSPLSSQHIRSRSKDWFTRNRNNVFERSDMSIRGPLLQ